MQCQSMTQKVSQFLTNAVTADVEEWSTVHVAFRLLASLKRYWQDLTASYGTLIIIANVYADSPPRSYCNL